MGLTGQLLMVTRGPPVERSDDCVQRKVLASAFRGRYLTVMSGLIQPLRSVQSLPMDVPDQLVNFLQLTFDKLRDSIPNLPPDQISSACYQMWRHRAYPRRLDVVSNLLHDFLNVRV